MSTKSGASGTAVAFVYVTTLFFAWGFVTSIIDPLIPAVREIFTLNFAEAMLTQFAWFIAYGVASLPAAALLARMGYSTSIVVALAIMVAGCLIIPLATTVDLYPGVLVGLFVIASGVTLLQVAANPLVAALGSPDKSHFRLTFSQAFNSLGTVIGPYLGASIMLSGGLFGAGALSDAASREESLRSIDFQFIVVAIFFALLAIFIFSVRKRITAAAPAMSDSAPVALWYATAVFTISVIALIAGAINGWTWLYAVAGALFVAVIVILARTIKSGWAMFGGLAIFLYVGSEVAIASVMINFLLEINFIQYAQGFVSFLAGVGFVNAENPPSEIAGKVLGLCYWGGAMVGRFVGSALLTRVPAGLLLTFNLVCAAALCAFVLLNQGPVAGIAALAVGFFNSIMFPTIFTLTLSRSSASTSAVSGLLCMSIVGGAALPWLAGRVADQVNLTSSFIVPLIGYLGIAVFAIAVSRAKPAAGATPPAAAVGH